MLWLLSGPPGFTCWIFFLWYSVLFTVESLSSLYLFLYLDLYVLGDDALISYGSFYANQTSMCLDPHLN